MVVVVVVVKRTSGDHPNYSIVEISYNSEIWRLEETCCHPDSSGKSLANAGVKNSSEKKKNNCMDTLSDKMRKIAHEVIWTRLRRWNLKIETEYHLIAALNAIKTNYIKVKIDNTQQNNESRLFGGRDETINHIISECSKLTQKECKTKQILVRKLIHWEFCKRLKFDHTNKWHIHKPESILKMRRIKIL